MFGRKRKQEVDGLGLPVDDGTGLSLPPPTSSVTVTPSDRPTPAPSIPPTAPVPPAAPPAAPPPAATPQIPVNVSGAAALAQIFSGQGPIGELIAQIKADPEGFRNRMIAQAQAAGVSMSVMTPQGMSPIGHPPGAPVPKHVDVIDELTKAADLHDKGALTDAEFATFKKRILGE